MSAFDDAEYHKQLQLLETIEFQAMATRHAAAAKWTQGGDLLPHVVDRLAATEWSVYARWPITDQFDVLGPECVTYELLANAINGLSWWLIDALGHPERAGQVVAYIGPNDVRLTALLLAAVKTGWVLFLPSPRNSLEAQKALFENLDCRCLITTQPRPAAATAIEQSVGAKLCTIPSAQDLMGTQHAVYRYNKTFEEARCDPLCIIHTSGSTGIPKPLVYTNETASRVRDAATQEPPTGVNTIDAFCRGRSIVSALPGFHGAGLAQYIFYAIPFGSRVISPPAEGIMTAEGVLNTVKLVSASVALMVPSMVAELAQQPELLAVAAKHLKLILYLGGHLPTAIGDVVASKVHLQSIWGASEVGLPPQLLQTPELSGPGDWQYVRFHPCVGAEFEADSDGTYELVIRRNENPDNLQPAFTVRGQQDLAEYRTKDLFTPHPTEPEAWRWYARKDDIIVFLNGEKTNPVTMELQVAQHRELSGALVIGAQRFQAALAVEPASEPVQQRTTADDAALIERIWPSIEDANRAAPAHARIDKSLVFVVPPHRRFVRAGKGTILRAASLKLLSAEIDQVYQTLEAVLDNEDSDVTLDVKDAHAVCRFVLERATSILGFSIDAADDFFERGMDSLQALQLLRSLRRVFHDPGMALSTIYRNPTAEGLASAAAADVESPHHDADADLIEPLLSAHSAMIDQISLSKSARPSGSTDTTAINVLLTGSTGSHGSFLLHALLRRPGIGHIYCLNRNKDDGGRAAQLSSFQKSGFPTELLGDSRVTFIKSQLTDPSLGLDGDTYATLQSRVQVIVHNAWPVNFNFSLSAFRPQFVGMVNLFTLAASLATAVPGKRFIYISSVSAVSRLLQTQPAPEAVLDSVAAPETSGYARSKFIAERLCATAAKSMPVQVLRIGQVAGAADYRGVWNRAEWLPSLVLSSAHLGCLPDDLGPRFSNVDWIPIDVVADTVVDVVLSTAQSTDVVAEADVLNVRNPIVTTWSSLVPTIVDEMRQYMNKPLDIVSTKTWLSMLEDSVSGPREKSLDAEAPDASNPGIKLLDAYRAMMLSESPASSYSSSMAIDKALAVSSVLKNVPAVKSEWVRKWVREWFVET